jgi:amino acid adenylation domain-containing protein
MRNRPEIANLIGFFVNTLVMRGDLSGNPSYRQLLGRLKHVAAGAYVHQDVPFEKLVEALQPQRDPSRSPLFQVMFVLFNDVLPPMELAGGLRLTPLEQLDNGAVKFDLVLTVSDTPRGLEAAFRYSTDLFDAATVERMLGHYHTLLEGIVADPDRPVGELPLLGSKETEQILLEHNATQAYYPQQWCIHQLVAVQADRDPEAVALRFAGEDVTYGELNERANQLGHNLQALGVGPEVRVGLFVERSPEMIVAMLAVLKAGGAYVPLDPAYPSGRLADMLEDAAVPVLLTQERLAERLPRYHTQVLCLDSDWAAISTMPAENPLSSATADNLAYVIYTSGSTGRPRGVMVTHGGLCNLIAGQGRFFQITPTSRVLQFASISFDASVSEIFTALCHGATLVLADAQALAPGPALVSLLRDEEISAVTLPPSVLAVLPPEEDFPAVKTLVVAGESCPAELVERWAGQGRRFVNAYGPTEVTVCASMGVCHGGPRPPAIGKPMANTQVFILDPQMQLTPLGVPGELYVDGFGLARGYLGRPSLTAERFVPHPFSADPGARLYRTGDRARWLPSGEIEYLGRADDQVKIRGFRVEPGEVEAALRRHPNVRDVAVVAREDTPGRRLAACVIPRISPAATASELRRYLRKRLPEYMVPSAYLALEALPRTPNGKVDRRALAALEVPRTAARRRDYVGPRTPLEEYLQGRWQEVLGLDRIDIHENFFDLGGDSLVAAALIFRLQEAFGEPVYVVSLFKAPTIAELAAYLGQHYPDAVQRVCGMTVLRAVPAPRQAIDDDGITGLRALIPTLAPAPPGRPAAKNPQAVFILSPPRSGSTLLRVMLGGHRKLFAPPELELLGFNTLPERRAAFTGPYAFWLEGTLRALMEVKECDAEAARALMEDCERRDLSVKEFYRLLQEWIGGRRLVDKTPSYALDLQTLRRSDEDFSDPLYIHLTRHPRGMIRSFEDAKLEQVFFRHPQPFGRRELAELIWVVSQQNILDFLSGVPAHRQHRVRFEDLVHRPRPVLEGICRFLELDFEREMVQPYRNKKQKMTDGIHPMAKMLGDVKFHHHGGIDGRVADRWQRHKSDDLLADQTRRVAGTLGYREFAPGAAEPAIPAVTTLPADVPVTPPPGSPLVAMHPKGNRPPLFCVHPPGGIVFPYADLAVQLRPDHPLYAFQGRGLDGKERPHETLEDMAAYYVGALRRAQPYGPYHLGGWSLGGTVAFEMARQLTETGEQVGLVALFDTGISSAGRDGPSDLERAKFVVGMARVHGLDLPLEKVLSLRPHEQLEYVAMQVARSGLVPANTLPYPLERVLQLHQAHITAAARYRRRFYPGKVTLFKCSVDLDPLRGPKAEDYGWSEWAAGVEVVKCPGSHRTMLREPHVRVTAERIMACLDRVGVRGGT